MMWKLKMNDLAPSEQMDGYTIYCEKCRLIRRACICETPVYKIDYYLLCLKCHEIHDGRDYCWY